MNMLADQEKFKALPADTRALILMAMNRACNAVVNFKENPGHISENFKPLVDGLMRSNGLNKMADQFWEIALIFDERYSSSEVPGSHMAQLRRGLDQAETLLLQCHQTGRKENATPTDETGWFDIRAVFGNEKRWSRIDNKKLSDDDLQLFVRAMRDYLQALPLHERYGIYMALFRNHRKLMPGSAYTNFRSHIESDFTKNLVGLLLEDSPTEGLAVKSDIKGLWRELTAYQEHLRPVGPVTAKSDYSRA